ncbi:MAG: CAP domain-containing protein [Burkholderiaceae bacterium]
MLNTARATGRNCGTQFYPAAPPLAWSTALESAAQGHSTWMQQNNAFSHTGANNSSVATRVSATGYDWTAVGENIAAGQPTLSSVVQAWLNSAGHCANIMSATYTDAGLAVAVGTATNTYSRYWTLVLAR